MERQNSPAKRAKMVKYLLYPILGMLVFYTNSQLNSNYFVKGYLSFIELQLVIVVIHFLVSKINNNKYRNTRNNQSKY